MTNVRAAWGWRVWLALAVPVVAVCLLLPAGSAARSIVYETIGVASTLMIMVAVRRHRPERPGLWWWMAAGQGVWVIGDIVYSVYEDVLHLSPFPSAADVFYLGSYPLILIGLAKVRGRRGAADIGGILDAGIAATGLGLLSWTFLIQPTLADESMPFTTRLVAVGYPAADILILALLAWLLTTGGARTASYAFLLAAVVLLLAADAAYSVLTTWFSFDGGITDAGWLLSYVLWAAAAWHPSMRRIGDPGRPLASSRLRQLALGVTMLVAPGLLLAQGLLRHGRVDWLGVSTGGALLCLLSLARYGHLVRRLQGQSARLAAMALHDEVTGLGNRHHLEQQLTDSLADPSRRTCLVVIDVDDFHQVNDRYGRSTGDALLAAVADRLRQAVPDGTPARIGGDEFGLRLEGAEAAEAVVERVRRLLGTPFTVAGHTLLVRACIGLADSVTAPGCLSAAELLRRADVAVDAARRTGASSAVRYYRGLDEHAEEQARIGAALRTGLDDGQFELYYQPIVDLADDRLVGVEALVRWHHPTAGLVGPDEFIPVAERTDLIVELGAWALREACAQLVRWDAALGAAAPGRVSVNVSARQLHEAGFADSVAAILAGACVPADRLTVEVTETAVFGGGQAVDTLRSLHEYGVRVALDDFGTGQSSLGLLRDCPVDVLKVDKSFVAALTDGGRDGAIVAGLVAIIDGLGLTAVAEGVENAAQAAHLRRLGYRFAQGYLFGRPMPAADLQRLLPPRQLPVPRPEPAAV